MKILSLFNSQKVILIAKENYMKIFSLKIKKTFIKTFKTN